MLKRLHSNSAQSVMSEYLLVFFLMLGMITAMTVYFRRAVQARIRDVNMFVVADIRERLKGSNVNAVVYNRGYEPYYTNSLTIISHESYSEDKLLPGSSTGIFTKSVDDFTKVKSNSLTLPPGVSD